MSLMLPGTASQVELLKCSINVLSPTKCQTDDPRVCDTQIETVWPAHAGLLYQDYVVVVTVVN